MFGPLLGVDALDPPGWVAGGGTFAAAIGAFVWLIKYFTGEVKDVAAKFDAAIRIKDAQILDVVTKFDSSLREMRAEVQKNTDRQFDSAREIAVALEHLNRSMNEIKYAMQELSGRVDHLDETLEEDRPPFTPKPARPKPHTPPGKGD